MCGFFCLILGFFICTGPSDDCFTRLPFFCSSLRNQLRISHPLIFLRISTIVVNNGSSSTETIRAEEYGCNQPGTCLETWTWTTAHTWWTPGGLWWTSVESRWTPGGFRWTPVNSGGLWLTPGGLQVDLGRIQVDFGRIQVDFGRIQVDSRWTSVDFGRIQVDSG